MAFEILMPKLSSTMEEGSVTQWFKKEGDLVEIGEAIFEVMTDKIAIEVESYEEGVLLKRYYDVDENVPINAVIGYIGEVGEAVPATAPAPPMIGGQVEATTSLGAEVVAESIAERTVSVETLPNEKVRATPAARKLARQKGIELHAVTGTGTNRRVHVIDIDNYHAPVSQPVAAVKQATLIPWRGMRKLIAEQMVKSIRTKPHVTMNADVKMAEVINLRQQLLPAIEAQTGYRLSYTEIIIKAVTVALKHHPALNAITQDDGIHQFADVNLGVAVSLAEGLVVPVIPQANHLGLAALTIAVKEQANHAKVGKLAPEAMKNGTFTISSLGKTAVKSFNPIINAPEVAILGVGGLYDAPQLTDDGQVVMGQYLTLSLSFDHRALDGAPAAAFLTTLVSLLESPYTLLI